MTKQVATKDINQEIRQENDEITIHEQYMRQALELAKKGEGEVNPNPLVGAVIVKEKQVIGVGYHEQYGGLHAERNALLSCTCSTKGATMYVTLEPCCHYGKTPPCTEAIIENGISKVYVGVLDPNPCVAGKGIQKLRDAGIEVIVGILEKECREINQVFFHFIKKKQPYVVMKYAMTMDGKIATKSGKSKWITGEEARKNVHKDRNKYMAIMVGLGTVLKDNPLLTCRMEHGRNPIRIIADTTLRTPLTSQIVRSAKEVRTIIATACEDKIKQNKYKQAGCEILHVRMKEHHIDLRELMKQLGELKIDSILLEGGGTLNESAIRENIVMKVQTYLSLKLFGGIDAKGPLLGIGVDEVEDAVQMRLCKVEQIGEDILIESEVVHSCSQES